MRKTAGLILRSRDRRMAAALCAVALVSASCSRQDAPPAPVPHASPAPVRSTPFVVAPDLPPLPAEGLAAAPRSPEVVRAVYEFAARKPDVLKYVPCFCGCEHAGHKGSHDCFVASRDANGAVQSWDAHGMT